MPSFSPSHSPCALVTLRAPRHARALPSTPAPELSRAPRAAAEGEWLALVCERCGQNPRPQLSHQPCAVDVATVASYLAHARLGAVCVSGCFLVLVCVRTQFVPSVATRVAVKIYRPCFCIATEYEATRDKNKLSTHKTEDTLKRCA